MLLALLASAAAACGSQVSSGPNATTTTAAQMEARSGGRAPLPPPSPPPVMGEMRSTGPSSNPAPQYAAPMPEPPRTTVQTRIVEQSRDPADIHITARLRSQLLDDDTLGAEGKHVRIVTRGRRVVLTGEVPTASQRAEIDAKARNFPGVVDVDDYIVVRP